MARMYFYFNVDATEQDLLGYYEFDERKLPDISDNKHEFREDYEDDVAEILSVSDI